MNDAAHLSSIAASLHRLEWMLGVLLFGIFALVAVLAFLLWKCSRFSTHDIPTMHQERFEMEASELLDSGKIDELLKLAGEYHCHAPLNPEALRYLALAHHRRGEHYKARQYLEILKDKCPSHASLADSILKHLPEED